MFQQSLRKLVAVLLVTVCPSALLMAELPSAMLYATGAVTLNGAPAAKSMSVFSGDRIDTAAESAVSINRSGSSLVVDPNSSVQYQSDGFTVLKGTARARTSKGMSAHAGGLSVIPKDNAALFDVSSDGKTVLVTSREGTLLLTDGIQTAMLKPGYSAKVILDPDNDSPKPTATSRGGAQDPYSATTGSGNQDQSPKPASTASGQEQGPNPAATTGNAPTKRKRGMIIWIVASAAAGAAIACAVACTSGGATPVSPVTP